MSYYTQDKAAGRRADDPLSPVLSPASPMAASNQVNFTQSAPKTLGTKDVGNQEQSQANDKDTGRENVPSSIALAGKRRMNVSMPANY